MPLTSAFSELPFAYLSSDDLISLLVSDNPNQSSKSFDPFTVMDDKYNTDLDITQSCLRTRYLNVPRADYIFIDAFPSISTVNATTTTLFSMNIRSIPTNFQSFIDVVLTNTWDLRKLVLTMILSHYINYLDTKCLANVEIVMAEV